MTYPVIPAGVAPRLHTPRGEAQLLRQQVAEQARRGTPTPPPAPPAICRVKLNVNVSTPAAADLYAQTNWVVGEDPDNLATLSTAAGTNSFITIAQSARYVCQVTSVFTQTGSSNTCVAFITRNAASAASSIVRDARNAASFGGDGVTCNASRSVFLNAGDKLYWGHWTYYASLLTALNIGVPTEISITQVGSR